MSRVEYADGTIVWRRSITAKILWAVGIGVVAAWFFLVSTGIGRALVLLIAAVATLVAWGRVWRPHLAATKDGLIIRRAMSAVSVPWANIAGVSAGRVGVFINVRAGQHIESAVPTRGPLRFVLQLHSDVDDAVALIEARAYAADHKR